MPSLHLLVVDLAAVRFHRRGGVTTAELADRTVLATCDTGTEVTPQAAAAATLVVALDTFCSPRLDADGRLVEVRLGLYNPFTAQVEAAGASVWSGDLVRLGDSGTVVAVDGSDSFVVGGSRFVLLDGVPELTETLTRAISAHC